MLGEDALGIEALGASTLEGMRSAWERAVADPASDLAFLVIVHPYQAATGPVPTELALGEGAIGAMAPGEEGIAGEFRLYFSDAGFTTRPSDDPPDTEFEPRAVQALRVDRAINLGPNEGRQLAFSAGSIDLLNTDGALDLLGDTCPVDGRRLRVLLGRRLDPITAFGPVFDGVALGFESDL